MAEKKDTSGGFRFPSRVSIPVPRESRSSSGEPPTTGLPPDASRTTVGGGDLATTDRTVESPLILDLSGVTEIAPSPPSPAPLPPIAPPSLPAPPTAQPTANAPTLAAPIYVPHTSEFVDALRSEIRFYRVLLVLASVMVFIAWLVARR